jgi:hypothetical protein
MARATFLLITIVFKVAHTTGLCMDLHTDACNVVTVVCNGCILLSHYAAVDRCGEESSFVKYNFVLRCLFSIYCHHPSKRAVWFQICGYLASCV